MCCLLYKLPRQYSRGAALSFYAVAFQQLDISTGTKENMRKKKKKSDCRASTTLREVEMTEKYRCPAHRHMKMNQPDNPLFHPSLCVCVCVYTPYKKTSSLWTCKLDIPFSTSRVLTRLKRYTHITPQRIYRKG